MEFTIPGTKEYMQSETFWINKLDFPDRILMSMEEIKNYNNKIFKTLEDLCVVKDYPEHLSSEQLYSLITNSKIPEAERYDDSGTPITKETYQQILDNLNLSNINPVNPVSFGIAVNATSVRSFPTSIGCYKECTDIEFDRFQETECPALEPVAILHISGDGAWYFIQMYNYRGWVSVLDIAVCPEKSKIFEYIETDHFLMVTGNRTITQYNPFEQRLSRRTFFMGTKIPLELYNQTEVGNQGSFHNFVIKLPMRNQYGLLEFDSALLSKLEPVHIGYVPFTLPNLIHEAFVLLGDRYDWGNKNNGRDCSSYVMNVYRTCGFELPRNADQQESCPGKKHTFGTETTCNERIKSFEHFLPGTLIFMDGHVMLYLGLVGDEPFMIHDFHSYSIRTENTFVVHHANEVAVTSTLLLTSTGKEFINTFTTLLMPCTK